MREPELLALVGVGDRDALIRAAEAVDDPFGLVAGGDQLRRADVDQVIDAVLDDGVPSTSTSIFGLSPVSELGSSTLVGGEDDCLHG